MKKFFIWFSLSVISIMAIYTAYKMSIMTAASPTYEGIAKIIVDDTMTKTGAVNTVTAIVFDFRGYDTLGEAFVLFTAITGSSAVLRKYKRRS
ncbi:MAG: hydrogen gas-evolving membrane-bound hydrogenase subunit E [Clostridiaceae bacterium]